MKLPLYATLLLLLPIIAVGQTTTAIQPAVCIRLTNCVLYDVNGNTVWSDLTWNSALREWDGFLEYGIYPNQQEFTDLVQFPVSDPIDPNPADSNHILYSVEFSDGNGTMYTEVLKGYSYYSRGSGGRGGGSAGIRYAITSGSMTIQ